MSGAAVPDAKGRRTLDAPGEGPRRMPANPPQRALLPSPPPLLLLLLLLLGLASASGEPSGRSRGGETPVPWSRAEVPGLGLADVSYLGDDPMAVASTTAVASAAATAAARTPFLFDFTTSRRRHDRFHEAPFTTKITAPRNSSSSLANITRRYKRDDEVPNPCLKFEADSKTGEFYSPDYPNRYPKNISCYRILTAENEGQVVKLEFRDSFDLEVQEECKYDYLEVRDGKYGFSKELGNFCRAFPFPEIRSSTRNLWLHFHSDASIEGNGFRAVWSSIPRPPNAAPETDECMVHITDQFEYIIRFDDVIEQKKVALAKGTELDCVWNITVPENWKILISFTEFKLSKPNECDINFVNIYDKDPKKILHPSLKHNFCGTMADNFESSGNSAYFRFYATKHALADKEKTDFRAVMTAIRSKDNKDKGCDEIEEFDCQDTYCIKKSLECNGNTNCRHNFDEGDDCKIPKGGLNMKSEQVIIILVVFTLLMSGLCFTFVYNCISKLIRDQKIIKEHIRQSRENRLDELGRKSIPLAEPCTEIGGEEHHHHRPSESPSVEVLANPKELVSPVTVIGREYTRERSIRLSVDLSDIHQSNNVSNATQERLKVSGEERETRDMECQTRESIFDTGFILKPTAHPAFTTFGFQTPTSSRKQSVEYHPSHHYHHHAHPHYHPQPYSGHHHHHPHRQATESSASPPSEQIEHSPVSRRCSVCHPDAEPPTATLCFRHSSTPVVPAPPGWSAHESMYGPGVLANLQLLRPPSPPRLPEEPEKPAAGKSPPGFVVRQRAVGSGENYGFIYGAEEKDSSEHTPSSGASSTRSGAVKPVKCPQVADSRFKTEAVIEVDQKRPFSIESTKSAPDVIATH